MGTLSRLFLTLSLRRVGRELSASADRLRVAGIDNYFPRLIKNRGRGLPPALATAAAARHTRTGAGSGGPPGHFGALFRLFTKIPLSGTPKNELCCF